MSGMDAMTKRIADSFEKYSGPVLVMSLFLTAFLAYVLTPLPAFTTDLASFAPDTDADEARERIEGSIGTFPHLVYINVKPSVGEGSSSQRAGDEGSATAGD